MPALTGTSFGESALVRSFLSGASSGAITCALFQPMDLVKTRLQMTSSLSTAPLHISSAATTTSATRNCIVSTIANVVRSESYRGLWNGLRPSLYRTVPGVGLYFTTLNIMKTKFGNGNPTLLENLAFGFTARAWVGSILLPIAVIKTRYESGRFSYRTVPEALFDIWRGEGLRGLFSGWSATIVRDAPYSGLYFMFYSKQKEILSAGGCGEDIGVRENFVCGLCAGVLACAITQPADVVKTHMQLNRTRYHGNLHCVLAIVKQDGLTALMNGYVPRCMRKSIISAFSWTLFEQIMRWEK